METDLSSVLYEQKSEPSQQSQAIDSEMNLIEACSRIVDCKQNL